MERVNLLPEDARLTTVERLLHTVDRKFPRVLAAGVGAVVAVTVLLSIGQAWGLHVRKKRLGVLKGEIQILEVELKNLEAFSKQLDQVEAELIRQKTALERKQAHLDAVRSRPRLWATVLKDLRRSIPRGVWLTELETGPEGALRIAGGAGEEDLVAEFMSSLKASPHFSDVGFNYTEKSQIGRVMVVRFEVVCRVVSS